MPPGKPFPSHEQPEQAAQADNEAHPGPSPENAGTGGDSASDAPVPPVVPAPGTSTRLPEVHAVQADEEEGEVASIRDVAHAPPGKPDGEVDTR